MTRVCSWCEAVLGIEPPLDRPGMMYAVCPECWMRRRKPKSTVGADTEVSVERRWMPRPAA